jgi:hypothetical protein
MDGRERIVLEDDLPRLTMATGLCQPKPHLWLLAGRTLLAAWWQQIEVERAALADGTGAMPQR